MVRMPPGVTHSIGGAEVHQLHVILVVDLVIAVLQRHALRAERVKRHELFGGGRIPHTLPNLPADEFAGPNRWPCLR